MDKEYGIFEYNENNFLAYIAYQTNTHLSIVKQKKHITYLHDYLIGLKKSDNESIFFIYENEYYV